MDRASFPAEASPRDRCSQDIPTSSANGNQAEVANATPLVLMRYRAGIAGETARTVHLVPLPAGVQAGTARALCGRLLNPAEVDVVAPGQGMPCSLCMLKHVTASDPSPPPATATPRTIDKISMDSEQAPTGMIPWTWD